MKFSKTILAFVMVAVLSLSMAFVAFAAEGTLEDPVVVEALDENNAFEVTVPANSTVYYSTAKALIFGAFTDLNGVAPLIENEGLDVNTYLKGWMGTSADSISNINMMTESVVYEIINTTDADITADVVIGYGPGSASNPHWAVVAEDGTFAAEVPAWGATYYSVVPRITADKVLDVSDVADDVTSIEVIIDGVLTVYWTEDIVDGVITDAFDNVNAWMTGSVVIGVCGPMEDITGTIALTAKPGTMDNPEYLVLDENGEAAVSAPADSEKYYAVVPFAAAGKMLDVSGIIDQVDAVTVIIDGVATTYWAEDITDGIITDAFKDVTMFTGSIMICVGGIDPVEGTIALPAAPGTYENPEYLVVDENGEATVNAPAMGEKYYAVLPQVVAGKALDVSAILDQIGAVSVIVDGVTSYLDIPEDGIIEDAFDEVNMLTGSVVIVVGGTMEPVEGTIALPAKAGTMENPNALVLNEEGKATVSVPAGETVYYWVVPAVAADKYLVLGDLGLTVSVYVDGVITPCEVDEDGNVLNAFEDVDKFFTNMVLVELTNTSEEDVEGTVALGIIEEEEAPQTGVAAALLTVVAVLSGGYVVSRRRSH